MEKLNLIKLFCQTLLDFTRIPDESPRWRERVKYNRGILYACYQIIAEEDEETYKLLHDLEEHFIQTTEKKYCID